MPSRQISTAPAPAPIPTHHKLRVPRIAAATTTTATATALSLLFFFLSCFRKISRKRTAPEADSKPPHRFRYSLLRRATDSFSPSRRLGQGGFGPVFYGTLPKTHQEIAVKIMDSGSLQGEREFQNELFFASLLDSQLAVSVLGFSSDRKRRRMLLVYEFMSNGNLQDALLHRKCPELMDWKKRLSIAVDIAKGLQYLHGLETPIIHGDVKPSNILLDRNFSAKIADFGLARLKLESQIDIAVDGFDGSKTKIKGSSNETIQTKEEELEENGGAGVDDYGSVVEETESVITTAFDELQLGNDQSPDNFVNVPVSQEAAELASPEASGLTATSPAASGLTATSPEASGLTSSPEVLEKGSMSEGNFDKATGEVEKQSEKRDWWWKQDSGAEKRDYVMEWIGTEIQNERPKNDWTGTASTSSQNLGKTEKHKKKNRKQLEWWLSMDEEKKARNFKKDKRRPAREWWKEEFCEELTKKKKKKMKQKGTSVVDSGDDWWPHDEDLYLERKKKNRSRSWGSRNSIDWWLDGLSGELWRGKRNNSIDSTGGEIPKSGGISSTPSMRGTVCYVAPEYGFGENPSEKCDVYSFGVLLLVLISGRRPLQVTNSPLSEYQRANLLSWARHLARAGKLIDLVDKSIQSLDHGQALVCIKVALLCLRKLPAHRPSMKQVIGMLTGELEPPQLPAELSPSPQSRFPFKNHKKFR